MSDDLIKKSDAIASLGEEPYVWTDDDEFAQGERSQWIDDVSAIKAVPSVGRLQGEWIERESVMDLGDGTFYECSNCGKQVLLSEREPHGIDFEACPYCLAKMKRFRF